MKIGLIGPSKFEKVNVKKEKIDKILEFIGKNIASHGHEIVLTPSPGLPYETANYYKKYDGKKIIGIVPMDDIEFGIRHIRENLAILNERVNGGTWYSNPMRLIQNSDIMICLGLSGGTFIEIGMIKYAIKFKNSNIKLLVIKELAKLPEVLEKELKGRVFYVSASEIMEWL